MNPFFSLLVTIIHLYEDLLIGWIILSWLVSFNIVNRRQPLVQRIDYFLNQMIDPALKPIRKLLPEMGGFDISPIVLFLLLQFAENSLYYYAVHSMFYIR